MHVNDAPQVTVAIPLYRSGRFLEVIEENLLNLYALECPVEILVSDRHLHDNTLDVLEERHGQRSELRFLRARDGIGWVEHFNLLLREARGTYFMWMPHDDSYPTDYVPKLLNALERDPSAILAFGQIQALGRRGYRRHDIVYPAPPLDENESWSTRTALRLATQWNPGIAFRGLFRREPLIRHGLFIRPTRRSVDADRYWVAATGFLGRWRYVPECRCRKRFYSGSTHTHWKLTPRVWMRAFQVLSGYGRDFAPTRSEAARAKSAYFCWTLGRLLETQADHLKTAAGPARIGSRMLGALTRWLVGPVGEQREPSSRRLPGRHDLRESAPNR